MKHRYLCIVVVIALLFRNAPVIAFEGNITMVKQTYYDTTFYTFTVKDNLVRIDEKNTKQEVMQSLIIDLKENKITALSPSQKLYTTIQQSYSNPGDQTDFMVIKGDNFKYIDGRKCFLWRVRNSRLNMEVSYWVFESDLGFFNDVTRLLSKTEDYSRFCLYFDQIPDCKGYFPMLMIEKTLLRDDKSKVSVQRIDHHKVDGHSFKVPSEYKYLRY